MAVGSFVGMIVGNSLGVKVETGSGLGEMVTTVGSVVFFSVVLIFEHDMTTKLKKTTTQQNLNLVIRFDPLSRSVKGLVLKYVYSSVSGLVSG